MRPQDLYHSGIVVDDVEATMRWFTETAGYRWCDPYAGDQVVETPEGELTIPLHITYTIDEPRLELLGTVPGTCWVPSSSGIHHHGYWSDDVDADVAALTAHGHQLEARAPDPDGTTLWAYCMGPVGTRIELVSRTLEPSSPPGSRPSAALGLAAAIGENHEKGTADGNHGRSRRPGSPEGVCSQRDRRPTHRPAQPLIGPSRRWRKGSVRGTAWRGWRGRRSSCP